MGLSVRTSLLAVLLQSSGWSLCCHRRIRTSMKFFLVASLLVLLIALSSVDAKKKKEKDKHCDAGRWGADCGNVCGHCAADKCAKATGFCDECDEGWEGEGCMSPVCGDCGPGICVSPGNCGACGDINLVGPNCEDIRLKGLLGSLIALGVISVSITLCGVGSVYYKKSQSAQRV